MECVQIDLNNLCRTCKNQSSEMKSLYYRYSESDEESPRLDEMLTACASVQVNNEDGLPKLICRSCFVQLKNAYSFKEQCEKTDLFLRDYLKNLKKVSIKEEVMTDLEFTSHLIDGINSTLNDSGQINVEESIENIKDDPESHSGESHEKDVDYVQIVDSNLTNYECRKCSKVFYTLDDLRCHKEIHTGNIENHCMATDFDNNATMFSDQSDGGGVVVLVVDEETMKPEVEASENNDQEILLEKANIEEEMYDVEAKEEETEITYGIKYESDASPHTEYLQRDGLRIHECDSCNKKFSRRCSLKRHKLSHVKVKPFSCMTCRKCFTRRDHLQKHMKLHLSTEVHSCDLCQSVFYRPENLARHQASKHNIREKKYKCQYCQKSFATEKYRDSHMKAHIGDRKFQCKTCEKTFLSKSHLTKHMKIHNDSSKKFLCSECGQRFIRSDDLVYHMRRHRGEKPFKCKFCGKGFPRTTDLTVHERFHTGEKKHLCVTCGRGFGRAYNLTLHMRTHTGEKPYCCEYCDAAFTQSSDLKAHVRRHTGERFQCELCPKTFLVGHLLKQHKRVVHGMNIVSNKRRLQPINKLNPDDPPTVLE